MINPIILNDGTFLYSGQTVKDYLSSLGFDREQNFEELIYALRPEIQEWDEGGVEYERQGDDWECVADGYLQAYNNLCEEINAMCETFLAGRKITKAQFVSRLQFMMEDGLLDY